MLFPSTLVIVSHRLYTADFLWQNSAFFILKENVILFYINFGYLLDYVDRNTIGKLVRLATVCNCFLTDFIEIS